MGKLLSMCIINRVRKLYLSLWFLLQMLRFSALCGPNEQKFGEILTWPKVISRPKFLPNLSTESWETQHWKGKNANLNYISGFCWWRIGLRSDFDFEVACTSDVGIYYSLFPPLPYTQIVIFWQQKDEKHNPAYEFYKYSVRTHILLYYICYIASMGRPEILLILYSEASRYYSSQNANLMWSGCLKMPQKLPFCWAKLQKMSIAQLYYFFE